MLDRPQQLPQVDFTSSKLRAQRLVLSAHGFKSGYAVADRLKSTSHEWQLRTRERFVHCVNTVTVHHVAKFRRTGVLMISRSTVKSCLVMSDSTYSYTLQRRFHGLSRSRSFIAHDSYLCTCTTADVTQCCSEVDEDGQWKGRWVAAQKPSDSIWQGKPACWETTGVQPRLPGPSGPRYL